MLTKEKRRNREIVEVFYRMPMCSNLEAQAMPEFTPRFNTTFEEPPFVRVKGKNILPVHEDEVVVAPKPV